MQVVYGQIFKSHRFSGACVYLYGKRRVLHLPTRSSAGAEESMDIRTVPVAAHHQEEACFTSPRLPYLPVAELASNNGHVQLLTMSRIQRSYITEYIFSLKDWVDKIAQREAVLSLHREKLFDATAYYRCQPVCEYYIFALRRILI